jgi:pimeloyl-ACP methyl ester carboxylesterase
MGQTVSYANNISGCGFGAGVFNPPAPQLNGHIGLAYINYAEYVDPTTSINKFITAGGQPVSLGLNGALPTGNMPIVFLNSGNGTNSGTGGNFESLYIVNQAPVLYSSPPGGGITVQTNTVDTVSKTASLVVQFEDAAAPLDIVVFALGNSVGRVSAASATRTLLK